MKKFKNLMKRGLATFLSLTLAVSTLSLAAFADTGDDAETDSNTTYTVEEITHNGVPVEGEAFDAMKASMEDALNGGSQEDADDAEPAEGQPPADEGYDKEPEGVDENETTEPKTIKLPVEVSVELQNHANKNLTNGDEEMPEIKVTYSYEFNGETVTGSYICNEENGEWKFEDGQWKFIYDLELPEGVTSVKFTQSSYDIDGYVINADSNHNNVNESEYVFGVTTTNAGFGNVYCLKSHADVSVEIGGVKDENGEDKKITTDEDGKQIVDYKPGDIITYKVTVTNDGVDSINSMLLTVTLPEGLEFAYWDQLPDGSWQYNPFKVEGFHEDGSVNENFKGVYDWYNPPADGDNSGYVYYNFAMDAEFTYAEGTKGETTVSAGTYILQIGTGYGTDPLSELGSSVTITLLARVIGEIESGDLELKAEGTTIVGVTDDATVTVYAPKAPEEPPVIIITPNPDPTPDPEPDPDPVEIEDPETPLGEEPEDSEEIEEPEIPLGEEPEIEIDEPELPLSDVPQTGDISFMWYGAVIVSVMGLLGLSLLERKKRQEN